jgi:hypothetical protein
MGFWSDYFSKTPQNSQKAVTQRMRNTILTGTSACTCESCQILDTVIGEAMLEWGRGLIGACREAVKLGAESDDTMNITLNGPSAKSIMRGAIGLTDQKAYATMNFTLGDLIAPQDPHLEPTPDLAALREAYDDDPVALELIKWIEGRLS